MKFKTGIKGTPEFGLQIPGFYKQETEAAAEPHRIGKGRREIWKWNFEFIQIERKAYKDFSYAELLSLKPDNRAIWKGASHRERGLF